MTKILKLSLAIVAVLGILIIFVHPATMLLPATYSKHAPFVHLLVVAIIGLLVPLPAMATSPANDFTSLPSASDNSERLALICTRLC